MAPLRIELFTVLTAIGLVSGAVMDHFDAYSRNADRNPEFDYTVPGKCWLTGCTRPPDRVCRGPLITLFPARQVDDRNGTKWKKGVKNCARACRDEGELDDGSFACDSFNYVYGKESNCLLFKREPNRLLGTRPGSTRANFTSHYCFTRDVRRCVGSFSSCAPPSFFD